nr:ABC transporter ATP-binding protein [Clostridiales bacterium]
GSGSGKTTLVNALIGYEKADATILLNGSDVYRNYKRLKYKIGFVPQKNLIRGKDTVIRTVDDAAQIRLPKSVSGKERKERIGNVMDLLGLTAGQDGLVTKKSGGQLRRICIAMELVTDPELFVLDEPDSGLDGVLSREIFNKLRQIADEGRIVIAITHTPDRVIDLFDKVIVLARDSGRVGRLAFYGSPQEAREFFGKETMEQIVMSVNAKSEGGEGKADELIEKYAAYSMEKEGGLAS